MSKSIVDRWLPRLSDRSIEVQEKSIVRLGQALIDDPSCRGLVVPALMSIAEIPGEPWANRIPSSVLYATEEIPRLDKGWGIAFLEFYLRLARAKRCVEEEALRMAVTLLERQDYDAGGAVVKELVAYVEERLSENDDSDARAPMFEIRDWYVDNA